VKGVLLKALSFGDPVLSSDMPECTLLFGVSWIGNGGFCMMPLRCCSCKASTRSAHVFFSTSCRRPRSRYLRHFVEGHQMRPVVYELYGSCFSWVGFPCGYISSITPGIFSSEMQSTEFADCKSRLTKIEMSRKEAIHAPWRSSMSVALKYV
jgi:hypothetical protein